MQNVNQANLATEDTPPQTRAWFPPAHEDQQWSQGVEPASRSGASCSVSYT